MSKRYVALTKPPKQWDAEHHIWQTERPSAMVYEPSHDPVDTGLVTAEGVPLYRTFEPNPIGFRPYKHRTV